MHITVENIQEAAALAGVDLGWFGAIFALAWMVLSWIP